MTFGKMKTGAIRLFGRLAAAALSAPACPAISQAPPTGLDYDIVTNGVVNGSMHVDMAPGGAVEIRSEYQSQDKVRRLDVSVQRDGAGIPIAMRRVGQAFAFQPIDESFTANGAGAEWRNRIERGSSHDARNRYYVPLGLAVIAPNAAASDAAPYEYGLLASAILRAPGRTLGLLPAGHAHAEVLRTLMVGSGPRHERVRLVALTGLGVEPDYEWLDEEGRLFAGHHAIRRGWGPVADQLDEARRAADQEMMRTAVARLGAPTRPPTLMIRDVGVFDPETRRVIPHRDVLLAGGRIASVSPSETPGLDMPKARVIDGRGDTLVAGLWDMHVHLSGAREALRHLSAGVTTVRDMGNDNAALAQLVDRIDRGAFPGPRVVRAGFIEGTGPSTTYLGRIVSTKAEALAAVDAYADGGFAQIKLYNQVRPEWVAAIAARAHARGLRLSGHVPFGDTAGRVILDGYDEIQHWVYLFLNFAPQPVTTGLTFTAARTARETNLASPKFQALIDLMRAHHTVMDMTLAVYEPLFLGVAGRPSPVFSPYADRLPPELLRQTALGPLPTPPGMTTDEFQAAYAKALQLANLLHQDGVQLVAGTDFAALGGLALPRELELLVQAGLPAGDVLRIATLDAARVMRRDADLGSVTPGKQADVIVVRGDPTAEIRHIRDLDLTIKGGVPYRPRDLLAASGISN